MKAEYVFYYKHQHILCKTAREALELYLALCVTEDEREYYRNLTGLEFEDIYDNDTIEALFRNVFENAILFRRV